MTLSEVFGVYVGCPVLILVGWIQSYRVWVKGADLSKGNPMLAVDDGGPGHYAFLLPVTAGFTLSFVGILIAQISGEGNDGFEVGGTIALAGPLMMLLGLWLYLFAWPRFLLPPQYRGGVGALGRWMRTLRRPSEGARKR